MLQTYLRLQVLAIPEEAIFGNNEITVSGEGNPMNAAFICDLPPTTNFGKIGPRMKRFVVYILLMSPLVVAAQEYNRDSILDVIRQLRQLPQDTGQINKIRVLGHRLIELDSALSRELLQEALEKSIAVNNRDAITNAYRLLGIWYSAFSQRDRSMEYYRLSLMSATTNNNQFLMAGAWVNMGNLKYWKGEYDSCIHFWLKADEIFNRPGIEDGGKPVAERVLDLKKTDLYSSMSAAYNTLHNLKKADEYIDRAIAINKKYSSPVAKAKLAEYMQQKADNYSANGRVEEALRMRLQYLPAIEQPGNLKTENFRMVTQASYQHISKEYLALKKADSARLFADKAMQLAVSINSPERLAHSHRLLATIDLEENAYQKAEQHLDAANSYYKSSLDPAEQVEYFAVLHRVKLHNKKYEEAYNALEAYTRWNDSLQSGERVKTFAEMENRYQGEKKDAQIQLQRATIRKKQAQNVSLIAGAAVLAIVFALAYRNHRNKRALQQQRIKELETEKQLTTTQALLQGQEDERSRMAKDLHDGLGGLLSGVKLQLGAMKGSIVLPEETGKSFNNALSKLDESINEMRRVAHNMMPEALLRLGLKEALQDYCEGLSDSQSFVIETSFFGLENKLVPADAVVVYRIVQELLNNAVKYARASRILVQVIREKEDLSITIEDDGIGFVVEGLEHKPATGLKNVEARVKYLKGRMDVQSVPGKGTSIHIDCKVNANG